MDYLILSHGGCPDGCLAATIAERWCKAQPEVGEVIVRFCDYGVAPNIHECVGRRVIITDFGFPIETMLAIAEAALQLTWIDHHKSNEPLVERMRCNPIPELPTIVVFDNNRSGAGLAWDYFCVEATEPWNPKPRPWFVDYVEDLDLWRHALPHSKEAVGTYIQSIPLGTDTYGHVLDRISLETAVRDGRAMTQYINTWASNVAGQHRRIDFAGYASVPIVSCSYSGISDVLDTLLRVTGAPLALGWFQRGDGQFQYSLRSKRGGPDVSVIAKQFGGGGHVNAAGFQSIELFPWEKRV